VKRFMGVALSSRHATRNHAVYLGIHKPRSMGLDYLGLRIAPPPPIVAGPRTP